MIRGVGHALPSDIVTNEDLELKVKDANAYWSKILKNGNGEMHELW